MLKYLIISFLLITICMISSFNCSEKKQIKEKKTTAQSNITDDSVQINLRVNILYTIDGQEDDGFYPEKYAKTINIKFPEDLQENITAYGAAYSVWLGPKNWTGKGMEGADGNKSISLYPFNGSTKQGPYIIYYEVPVCWGCKLETAAPYFSKAMEEYNENFNKDGKCAITIPAGMKIVRKSNTLVEYYKPKENGLTAKGVIYFNKDDEYDDQLSLAEITLPAKDSLLTNYLLNYFIEKEGIK